MSNKMDFQKLKLGGSQNETPVATQRCPRGGVAKDFIKKWGASLCFSSALHGSLFLVYHQELNPGVLRN